MHYKKLEKDICGVEAGPVPHFPDSSFSPEMAVGDHSYGGSKKRSATESSSENNKRKKVVHWTEDEHKLFLLGLEECGKGAWTNIARKFVMTKTPTQVASHAQKYYIRQKLSEGGKDDNKKRSSIHDITLLDIMENTTPIEDKSLPLIQESQIMPSPPQQMKETSIQNVQPEWINRDNNNDQPMVFNPSNYDEMSMSSSQVMPSPQLEKSSIQNVEPEWINVGHNNNQLMVFNPNNYYEVGGAQKMNTSIQNVQPKWNSCDYHNDQLMGFNPSNCYEVGGAQHMNTSIQNVQPEWISCDYNNDQLMGFNPSNYYEVGGAQQMNTSIQNVQPEWISCDYNNDQLMGFNPSNYYEVGGAQQMNTNIQNVQPEWISYDYNNDQLMGFNPSNDGMSMLSSQDHQVTGAQDLCDIHFHCTCAKRQSSGFQIASRL